MRRITKGTCPASLSKPEVAQEVEAMKLAFAGGQQDFRVKSSIYGAKSVKNALIRDQHGKCAFCESVIYVKVGRKWEQVNQYGDVEHFRPKGNVKESGRKEIGPDGKERTVYDHPGYFWLAYEWTNLSFSCQICNQAYKRDHFPVAQGTNWSGPDEGVASEQPLLIDPHEDPSAHIEFEREVVRAKTERGSSSILRCGLHREGMTEMRRRIIADAQTFLAFAEQGRVLLQAIGPNPEEPLRSRIETLLPELERAEKRAADACRAEAPFSACIRSFVAAQGRLDLVEAAGPA